jgi:hypothetical protein
MTDYRKAFNFMDFFAIRLLSGIWSLKILKKVNSIMVKRGSNFIPLVLDTRLLVALNGKASDKRQLNATYIMALLVEHCRDVLEPDTYEELKNRYNKTIEEQYREKQAKEKERLKFERRKLEAKEKELEIKHANSLLFGEQTRIAVEKPKQKEIEELYDSVTWIMGRLRRKNPDVEKEKNELRQIAQRLKELGEIKETVEEWVNDTLKKSNQYLRLNSI